MQRRRRWGRRSRGSEDRLGECREQVVGLKIMQRFGQVVENLFLETRLDYSTGSEWTGLDLNRHGKKDRFEKSIARKLTLFMFLSLFSSSFLVTLFLIRIQYGNDMM